ncbi:mariner Mos1 transposase [Trichonephila clavipes]|nr:mariner Mos1 transposase [Trichonephila clavipes]
MDRISICEAFAKRNEIDPFLKRMLIGDEKWVTISAVLCENDRCQSEKRPELANRRSVVFHQDNARLHTSIVNHQKPWVLGWEALIHSPYSTDLESSDYHLFLALQNLMSDKKLESREDCANLSRLLEFFANKDQDFCDRGIMKLPLKWQQIVQQNGAYLTQVGQSEHF